MPKVAPIDQRKADHIKINLEQDVRSALTTGLEKIHFVHEALPELNLDEIDTGRDVVRIDEDVIVSELGRQDFVQPIRGRLRILAAIIDENAHGIGGLRGSGGAAADNASFAS